jgi:hypothetical protein
LKESAQPQGKKTPHEKRQETGPFMIHFMLAILRELRSKLKIQGRSHRRTDSRLDG